MSPTRPTDMASARQTPWLPIQHYALSLLRTAQWGPCGQEGVESRDLGLADASNAAMTARHLRAGPNPIDLARVLAQRGQHFQFLYVLKGELTFAEPDGTSTILAPGTCVHQPGLGDRHGLSLTGGGELLELAVPARPRIGSVAFDLELPEQAGRAIVNPDTPTRYIQGDGPRKYFLYRDLEVASATDGSVHVHIIRATGPSADGGTGWHRHSMCQIFYVLSGWAILQVQGQPDVRMAAGDAMCIAAGTAHNVPAFSADYSLIEVCIPATYETVETPEPARS